MKASLAYLKECLKYNPETGTLSWRHDRPEHHFKNRTVMNRWNGVHAEKNITCIAANGYIVFNLNSVMYLAHRVAFAIDNDLEMFELPEQIDHIDTCRTNNKRSNLRAANAVTNQHNQSLSAGSTSGYKGVSWGKQRGKWRASISIGGKQKHLGFYDDPRDAHEAYVAAANENFGDFARAA